jgi:hypothetical protein
LGDPFEEEPPTSHSLLGFSLWKDDHLNFSLRRTPKDAASSSASSSTTSKRRGLTRRPSFVGGILARRPSFQDKLTIRYTITLLEASGLPTSYANQLLFVSWRRGSKKENQGKTKKSTCDRNGHVVWEDAAAEETSGRERNSFSLKATVIRDQKTQGKLEEKNISFTLQRQVWFANRMPSQC